MRMFVLRMSLWAGLLASLPLMVVFPVKPMIVVMAVIATLIFLTFPTEEETLARPVVDTREGDKAVPQAVFLPRVAASQKVDIPAYKRRRTFAASPQAKPSRPTTLTGNAPAGESDEELVLRQQWEAAQAEHRS